MSAPQLVGLCASHIANSNSGRLRLLYFEYMVQSWAAQTMPLSLYVSLSCDASVATDVARVVRSLRGYSDRASPLHIVQRDTPHSQFQHYKLLAGELSRLAHSTSMWVLFSDDDDLWHPQRAEQYSALIGDGSHAPPATRGIGYVRIPIESSMKSVAGDTRDIVDASCVDIALHSGRAMKYKHEEPLTEYLLYSVPLQVLRRFVDTVTPPVLAHAYADCFFARFLTLCPTGDWERRTQRVDGTWLYFERSDAHLDHAGDGKGRSRPASPDVLSIPESMRLPPTILSELANNLADFLSRSALPMDMIAASFVKECLPKVMPRAELFGGFVQPICESILRTRSIQHLVCAPLLEPRCVVCLKPESSTCGRCKLQVYCSPSCQKKHWPMHKAVCASACITCVSCCSRCDCIACCVGIDE